MNQSIPPSEEELHAYVDGELDTSRHAEIEAYLQVHPLVLDHVLEWRRNARMLRSELAHTVARRPNPRLDVGQVRRRMILRARVRIAAAAILVVAVTGGVAGGWQLGHRHEAVAPMADAVEAYRVFAVDANRPVEIGADNEAKLQKWLSKRLGRPITFPDLHGEGFDLLGGRLLATAEGPAALIFYQDKSGQRVSLYIRQSDRFARGTQGNRSEGGLLTHYWYEGGYGFAVVGRADDPRATAIHAAMRSAG